MTPSKLSNLAEMAHDHVNFQASMMSAGLSGVANLDKEVNFPDAADPTKVTGKVSLRHMMLYNYMLSLKTGTPYLWRYTRLRQWRRWK